MTRRLTATETKAKILALLSEVENGDELEITRHGKVIARLVPARGANALKGCLEQVAMSAAGEEDLFTTGAAWDLP